MQAARKNKGRHVSRMREKTLLSYKLKRAAEQRIAMAKEWQCRLQYQGVQELKHDTSKESNHRSVAASEVFP